MPSTINFSGLSSSIQWGDIVDATIDRETELAQHHLWRLKSKKA